MRLFRRFAVFAALLLTASPALAQKCFNDDGTITFPVSQCYYQFDNGIVTDGKPFLYDGRGWPVLTAFTEGKKAHGQKLCGARDATGRVVVPAQFSRIKALSPWLAMGGVPRPEAKRGGYQSDAIYLLNLRSGAVRATPYVDIVSTHSPSRPGLLLGRLNWISTDMALITEAGAETGVQIRDVKLANSSDFGALARGPQTFSPGVLKSGDINVTIEGKPAAGGLPLYHGGQYGVFADSGRKAPNITGDPIFSRPALNILFLPLDSVGQTQVPPKGVLGMVRTELGWYYARETTGGGVVYQYFGGGVPPDLAARQTGPQYTALHSYKLVDLGRTAKGWARAGVPNPSAYYTDPKVAAVQISDQLIATAAANAARYQAERQAAAQAESAALRSDVIAAIDRAGAEKWRDGLGLQFLQDRVVNYGLEEYYRSKGLPMERVEDIACRRGRQNYCTFAIQRSASLGSSFEWTWQNSFDNASKLRASQNAENCAAALKGAARICTRP